MDIFLLFCAAFLAGIINTLAGGGSFITYPALLLTGISPISANATNTFISLPGYASGMFGLRKHLKGISPKTWVYYCIQSIIATSCGAFLLLYTSNQQFLQVVPWLMLTATLLFFFGGKTSTYLKRFSGKTEKYSIALSKIILLTAILFYSGFFNAGAGIMLMAYLLYEGRTDIHTINALKLFFSSVGAFIATILFQSNGLLAWQQAIPMIFGIILGGLTSSWLAHRVPTSWIRFFAGCTCITVTSLFFIQMYF